MKLSPIFLSERSRGILEGVGGWARTELPHFSGEYTPRDPPITVVGRGNSTVSTRSWRRLIKYHHFRDKSIDRPYVRQTIRRSQTVKILFNVTFIIRLVITLRKKL